MGAVRADGYMNIFSGAGMMGRDPFAATRYKKRWGDWFAQMREADDLFTGNGLAQRIVSIPAEDAIRAGWKIDLHGGEDTPEKKQFYKEVLPNLRHLTYI